MTVTKLIEQLKQMPQDAQVYAEVRKKCGNCIHWKPKGVSSWGKCDAGHPKIKSFMRNGYKFNTCDYKSKNDTACKDWEEGNKK